VTEGDPEAAPWRHSGGDNDRRPKMKWMAIGVGAVVLTLALVAGGVALATRSGSENASEAVPATELPSVAPSRGGPAATPALKDVARLVAPAPSTCAGGEGSEAGDDRDPSGEDSPSAGDGDDDCRTAAEEEGPDDEGDSGEDRADSADDRAESGDDRAESGDDKDDSGDDPADSGDNKED
jgi:hypothetical protein